MSPLALLIAVAAAGWVCAAAGVAAARHARARAARGARLVAQAAHELRGSLCAAQLGLGAAAGHEPGAAALGLGAAGHEPGAAALGAVELELQRAALALEDLTCAREGTRRAPCPESVDLSELVERLAPGWALAAQAAGVTLTSSPEPGCRVHGDRLRLAQALANLVANAIEHGRGGVAIRVATRRGRVRAEVCDEGSGLPAPVQSLALAGGTRTGRRGHGLAIADRIAREHGGRLAAAPAQRGSKLVLDLPAELAAACPGPAVARAGPAPAGSASPPAQPLAHRVLP